MKNVINAVSIWLFVFILSVPVVGSTTYSFGFSSDDADGLNESILEELKNNLPEEAQGILPEGWETNETADLRFSDFLGQVLDTVKDNLMPVLGSAARLLSVLLIAAIFYGFRDTLSGEALKSAVELAVVAGSALAILEIELSVLHTAKGYIASICNLMNVILPVMGGVCLSSGASTMAAVTNVEMMSFAAISGNLFSMIVEPLSCVSLAVASVSNFGPTKLRGLIKSLNWLAGTVIAILLIGFTAFLGAQTKLAASADSIRIQGVKFAVSNFIPFVGSALSDALGTLSVSFSVIKNSVGAIGIILVVFMTLPVLINLFLNRFVLFIGKSVADLLGCTHETSFLEDIASVFALVTAVVIMISVLFIILLALCVNTVLGVKA